MEAGAFTLLYLDGDAVTGALCVGRTEDVEGAPALVRERGSAAGREAELADASRPLAA